MEEQRSRGVKGFGTTRGGEMKTYDADRIAILVPCNGRIEPDCEEPLVELENRGFHVWRCHGINILDMVRSWMVAKCLQHAVQGVFFIDSDIAFKPEDVERLIKSGKPFCCGVYPKKNGADFAAIAGSGQRWTDIPFGPKGVELPIQSAGMGFAFIDESVFKTIALRDDMKNCVIEEGRKMVPFFMPMVIEDDGHHFYLEPDYAFCRRASEAGIQLWADTTIELDHLGNYRWTYKDVFINDALRKTGKATYTLQDVINARGNVDTNGAVGMPASNLREQEGTGHAVVSD